jgi:hypothetical protein
MQTTFSLKFLVIHRISKQLGKLAAKKGIPAASLFIGKYNYTIMIPAEPYTFYLFLKENSISPAIKFNR